GAADPGGLGAGQICRHGDFAGLDHDGRVVWRRADRVHRGTAVPRLDRRQPVPAPRVRLGQSPAGPDLPPAAWAASAGRPGTVADAARRLRGRAGFRVAARKVRVDPRAVDPAWRGERRDRVDRGHQDRGLSHERIVGTEFEHGAAAFFDLQPGLRLALLPRAAGAVIVKPAQDTFWGGYAGYFQDPD